MSESENINLLKAGYEMWSQKSPDSIEYFLNLVSPNVVWRSMAEGAAEAPYTKQQTGPEGVKSYLMGLTEDWDLEHYTVNEYIAQGDRVVVLADCAFTHKTTGKTTETPKADVWEFRDGKIVSFHEFYDTQTFLAGARSD
ncbi:MAG: nuclear transport factor 2 family protein [Lysobacterales bacterium]